MHIVIIPQGKGLYKAQLNDRTIVELTHTPFYDAARALKAEGVPGQTELTMSHVGSTTVSLRSTVGVAAGRVVKERDKAGLSTEKFYPHPLYASKHHDPLPPQASQTGF